MARDTTTGADYEEIVERCIRRSCTKRSLTANPQVTIGVKPGGGNHRIDWELVADEDHRALVSCKTQTVGGTAEEKVAYEVIKLLHAMNIDPRYKHAWLVLGGSGWSAGMKRFIAEELPKWLPAMTGRITVVSSTDDLMSIDFRI